MRRIYRPDQWLYHGCGSRIGIERVGLELEEVILYNRQGQQIGERQAVCPRCRSEIGVRDLRRKVVEIEQEK